MIRLNKPVKLMEWGEGTSTLNQVWREIGQGTIRSVKKKNGTTTMLVEVENVVVKQNEKDNYLKVLQQGEGMTPRSQSWGEVAMGQLAACQVEGTKTMLQIEIATAAKVSKY